MSAAVLPCVHSWWLALHASLSNIGWEGEYLAALLAGRAAMLASTWLIISEAIKSANNKKKDNHLTVKILSYFMCLKIILQAIGSHCDYVKLICHPKRNIGNKTVQFIRIKYLYSNSYLSVLISFQITMVYPVISNKSFS